MKWEGVWEYVCVCKHQNGIVMERAWEKGRKRKRETEIEGEREKCRFCNKIPPRNEKEYITSQRQMVMSWWILNTSMILREKVRKWESEKVGRDDWCGIEKNLENCQGTMKKEFWIAIKLTKEISTEVFNAVGKVLSLIYLFIHSKYRKRIKKW